jgi:PPK2 family polyphosphate:nucleotide phosphotransferase
MNSFVGKKKIDSKTFIVHPKEKIKLSKRPTLVKPIYKSKKEYKRILVHHIEELKSLQNLLYASNRYSVLLIFQAMDAAGKDSAIKHVMSGINPQGCQVFSFKHPSIRELEHDFLWRAIFCLPERGKICIYNRSYYEEVLIVKVHPEILHSEGIPHTEHDTEQIWQDRYSSIEDLEKHLHRNGTRIIKFFLHLSNDEQRKRFLKRIDRPEKVWKFSSADINERKFWNDYMKAYEDCLSTTSTADCPWYVVPADDKENAHIIISQIILDMLRSLKLEYPKISPERSEELQAIRKTLSK